MRMIMSNFVAINAKIDAMYSKLLSPEDFEPLISTNFFKIEGTF